MKVAIIGAKGNMGFRYCHILNYLGVKFIPIDVGLNGDIKEADAILIATPTHTHFNVINEYRHLNKPILCEKPLSTNIEQVKLLCEDPSINLRMINQYEFFTYFPHFNTKEDTEYDYFKTGDDGLFWDCLNIIGLANGNINLSNTSPIWTCRINGQDLSIAQMDHAYIWNIDTWLNSFLDNKEYALKAHLRVEELLNGQNSYRDTD